MKTLDEVITLMEDERRCDVPMYKDDVLHYLKIFQAECERVKEQLADLKEEYRPNDPLTWDELKQMEGKPVWVEERYRNGDLKSAGWWLIDYWSDDQICIRDQGGNSWLPHRVNIGRDWQAYRKERE